MKTKSIDWKVLLLSLVLSLGVGILAGAVTGNAQEVYSTLTLPAFAPPAWVFPLVWTLLYILMGISAYLVYTAHAPGGKKQLALRRYVLQLAANFFWSILFFGLGQYLLAFLWLLFLWGLVFGMIRRFYAISPIAAYLQIPYLLWITFAGVLNLAIVLLN